jgi:hypothetical protein
MDLLLGVVPKPAATSPVKPLDGHAPSTFPEETAELPPPESPAPELPAEPAEEIAAIEAPGNEAAETVVTAEPPASGEPAESLPAPKTRRPRRRTATPAAAAPTAESSASEPTGEAVVAASPLPVEKPTGRRSPTFAPQKSGPDEVLEPAYIPMKLTVMVPAVALSELIRTVQTIRRMTGRRQGVNQGTVVAAALEMAFEEFRTKGATSQLVEKLRIE